MKNKSSDWQLFEEGETLTIDYDSPETQSFFNLFD